MGHAEAHLLHGRDHRRGRRRAAGRDLHGCAKRQLHGVGRVDQHRQHHRRAAHVRHAVARDGREDERRIDAAQADMRAADRRDRPRVGPAAAVEHRQRPEIDGCRREPESQRVAERVEVGAAMVIDDALGIAGGARGVEQADGLPFVGGRGSTQRRGRPRRGTPRSPSRPGARRPRRSGSSMSITGGRRPTFVSAGSTVGENSRSVISSLASPCSRMKAIARASSRELSALRTAPAIGTA